MLRLESRATNNSLCLSSVCCCGQLWFSPLQDAYNNGAHLGWSEGFTWFLIHSEHPGGGDYYSPRFAGKERGSKEMEPLPRCTEAQVFCPPTASGSGRPTLYEMVSWGRVDTILGTGSQAASQSWHQSASLSIIFKQTSRGCP